MSIFFKFISISIILLRFCTVGLLFWNYTKLDKILKRISQLFLMDLLSEVVASICASVYHHNNLFVFHLTAPLEIYFLGQFFFDFYEKNGWKIRRLELLIPMMMLCVLNTGFIQPYDTINSYALTFLSLFVICNAFLSFYLILDKNPTFPHLFEIKWLIIIFFVVHSTSFMILLFGNHINQQLKSYQSNIWIARAILLVMAVFIQFYLASRLTTQSKYSI